MPCSAKILARRSRADLPGKPANDRQREARRTASQLNVGATLVVALVERGAFALVPSHQREACKKMRPLILRCCDCIMKNGIH